MHNKLRIGDNLETTKSSLDRGLEDRDELLSSQRLDTLGSELLANAVLALLLGHLDALPDLLGVGGVGIAGRVAGTEATLLKSVTGLERLGADGGVGGGVDILQILTRDTLADVGRELLLVSILIGLLELLHVGSNVTAEDVLSVLLSILRVSTIAIKTRSRESAGSVRDIEATVTGTLQSTPDTSTSGGRSETDIKESSERSTVLIVLLDVEFLTGDLLGTLVRKLVDVIDTTGQQQTSAVTSSVVGQTYNGKRRNYD